MKKLIAVMMLSALGTAVSFASVQGPSSDSAQFAAPEIDPSSAVSGLTLLLGGLTVLRGRMAKNQ